MRYLPQVAQAENVNGFLKGLLRCEWQSHKGEPQEAEICSMQLGDQGGPIGLTLWVRWLFVGMSPDLDRAWI